MALFAIYARAANGVIGREGMLPWHLPPDLRRFKTLTMGKPMIMGRKTFESFPRPLPGRRHIVLTRDPAWRAAGAEIAATPDEAVKMAGDGEVAVIGGAEVFRQLLTRCNKIELTEIHADFDGDTTMAPVGPEWREATREEHPAVVGSPAFAFVTLVHAGLNAG